MPKIVSLLLLSISWAALAAPRYALNVDGQANYSFLAPWSNIAAQFDPGNNITYFTGYKDGDYATTWTGPNPSITGGAGSFLQVTGAGQGVFHLHHDTPNYGGIFSLALNGASNLDIKAPDTVTGTPFRQQFLDKINGLHPEVIRYMDWMQTVGSPVANWSDRTQPTDFYRTRASGVAYEDMIALSNKTNASMWINIPHKATDDYVANLAKLIKSNLNPNLQVYVEYSNELWNGGDQAQGTYNLLQARSDPQFTKPDDTGRMAQRAAERLRQINEIFKANGLAGRVKPRIGGFIANPYWGQWQIDWLKSKNVNLTSDGYGIAIAPYAPGSENDLGLTGNESRDQIFQAVRNFMNGSIKTWIQQNKGVANAAGIPLDSYEAAIGSFYAVTNSANQKLLPEFIAMQDDPRMAQLEKDFINMWDTQSGNGLYDIFGLTSPYSQYGQWGLFNDANATHSVKYDAVASLAGVPEPAAYGTVLVGFLGLLARRNRK